MSASGEPLSGEVIVYETPEGEARVNVRLERETVWRTQRQMAELFDTSTDNAGLHLKNVFDERELIEAATTEDYSVVQAEGRRHVRRHRMSRLILLCQIKILASDHVGKYNVMC